MFLGKMSAPGVWDGIESDTGGTKSWAGVEWGLGAERWEKGGGSLEVGKGAVGLEVADRGGS